MVPSASQPGSSTPPIPRQTRVKSARWPAASPQSVASMPRTCATRSTGVLDSIDETLRTARAAGAPVIISHHKCAGPANWGRTRETLPRLETAASRQQVNLDVYPYTAGSTNLRLDLVTDDYPIRISWSKPHPEMAGRELAAIARDWGCSLLDAARRLDPAGAIYFQMMEDDVRRVMSSPLAMIGSDGLPHDIHPHPRLWGTFPRVIGHYARDEGLFTVESAIHKMTGLPAQVFRLQGPRPRRARLLLPISFCSIPKTSGIARPMIRRSSSPWGSSVSM